MGSADLAVPSPPRRPSFKAAVAPPPTISSAATAIMSSFLLTSLGHYLHQGSENAVLSLQRFGVGLIGALQYHQIYELVGNIDVGILQRARHDSSRRSTAGARDGWRSRGRGLRVGSFAVELETLVGGKRRDCDLRDVDVLSIRIGHRHDAVAVYAHALRIAGRIAIC